MPGGGDPKNATVSGSLPRTEPSTLEAEDGLELLVSHRSLPDPRGRALILHGYAEHQGRYGELVERLAALGCECHLIDLRGHGRSQGDRGYVERFELYRRDLDRLLDRRPWSDRSLPRLLLGHSLGGLIALDYAIHRPAAFDLLAVSSPFLEPAIELPTLKLALGHLAARIAPRSNLPGEIDAEALTHDPDKVREYWDDPLVFHTVNPHWFLETRKAQHEVHRRAGEIGLPTLFLLGDADSIADPERGREVFARLGSEDKQLHVYPGFFHELFNESGRDRVFADLETWLEAHTPH